jgi:hypothetical protein
VRRRSPLPGLPPRPLQSPRRRVSRWQWLALVITAGSLGLSGTAVAQTGVPLSSLPPPGTTWSFLPRMAFHLTGEHVSGDDERFVWNANFGGELDVLGYPGGRATFFANYEVMLGEELKAFDPNQGNYHLAGSASRWVHGVELAGVFHHESRHLSDRLKTAAVDWNMVGVRAQKALVHGRATTVGRVDLRGVIQRSMVDYEWELDARVRTVVQVRPHVSVVSAFTLDVLGVDGTGNRGTQVGARGEGGIRLEGGGGAIELYLAVERQIDPYQLEFSTASWFIAGFRLLNR